MNHNSPIDKSTEKSAITTGVRWNELDLSVDRSLMYDSVRSMILFSENQSA